MAARTNVSADGEGKEKERDVMKEAAENLASVKDTLAAIDDLNKRWEVCFFLFAMLYDSF